MAKKNNSNYKGKNPKKAPRFTLPRCPVCGASIKMIPESEMNFRFHMDDNHFHEFFWVCKHYPACDTYIPADNRTKRPFGTLAGPVLRHKRYLIHLWEDILVSSGLYTRPAYRTMIASLLNIECVHNVHVRDFSEYQCETVLSHLRRLYENTERINRMVDSRPRSALWFDVRGINTGKNHNVIYNDKGEVIGHKPEETPAMEARRAMARNRVHNQQLGTF